VVIQMPERRDELSLDLSFDIDAPAATVDVVGDIDMLTAPALAGVLHALLDGGRQQIVIDLSRCGFVDARGVALFAEVARRAAAGGATVAVRSASWFTTHLLDIAGVRELVVLVDAAPTELSASGPSGGSEEGATAAPIETSAPVGHPTGLATSSADVVDAALRLVTALAATTVTNADGVSVTLERHGRLTTVAASNDKVSTMDRHQYETGEGPCLEARTQDRWFYIESLAEETRWPMFVPLALDEGIHSILSSPLKTRDRAQGALNIYSATTHAFGEREQELAALFADQASKILTAAAPDLIDEDASRRFTAGLAARQIIHPGSPDGQRRSLGERCHRIALPIRSRSEHDGSRLRDRRGCLTASRTRNVLDMGDEIELLERARRGLGLSVSDLDLWWRYFAIGGMSTELEIEAILYQALIPSTVDLDMLAVALNERFSELGGDHPLPYSDDA
jgi:anti-anti-sigma factor